MINIENISKSFFSNSSTLEVLDNISMSITDNTIISILGPSGCGKTTLLNIIAGILKADNGKVKFSDSITPSIGLVFQNDILLPWRNVKSNILLSSEITNNHKIEQKTVDFLLDEFDLKKIEKFMPSQLSGGMKQKIAFARTILPEPNILLLDEPFSNLDFRTKIELEEYLLKYVTEKPARCCIFVTHNVDEAVSISDKIIFFSKKPTKIIEDKYIGSNHRHSLLKFRLSTNYEKLYTEVAEIINDIYENKYL